MKVFWLGVVLVGVGALGQDAPPMKKEAKPVFEVAAIKLTKPGEKSQGFSTDGSRVILTRETVASMIMFSFGVHHKQIVGGPAWLEDDAYDVNGKADVEGEPDTAQMQQMVRALLVDRYGLKFHREKRDLSYFALRVGSGGAKMAKEADPKAGEDQTGNGTAQGMVMKFTSNSMEGFRVTLQYFVDRPVVNETGLPGRYDFTLKWTPDTMKAGEGDGPPGLMTAVREELGLKLESAKGPVEVIVVDAIGRPSEN